LISFYKISVFKSESDEELLEDIKKGYLSIEETYNEKLMKLNFMSFSLWIKP